MEEYNEPYYCSECKRNHTDGEIYKNHLCYKNIKTKKTYIMREQLSGAYKIGSSDNPKVRLKLIQAMNPNEVTLELIIDQNVESLLHVILKDYRGRGEWFNFSSEVLDNIKEFGKVINKLKGDIK